MKRSAVLLAACLLAMGAHADMVLRQSTASQAVQIGPFVDTTGAVVSGLTLANTDIRISKNGANIVAKNSGGCTYDEVGMYTCTFDATDSDTSGRLQVMVNKTGALPVYHEFQVATQSIYDSCCATGAASQSFPTNFASLAITAGGAVTAGTVSDKTGYALSSTQTFNNTGTWTGNISGTVTTATNLTNLPTMPTDWITASGLSAGAGTEIGTANWASTTRSLTTGTGIVLAKGTGITGFNDLSAAQVNSEVDTALSDIYLNRLFAVDYDPASKPGIGTAFLNELVESDAGVTRFTANALEQGPVGGGGGINITQIESLDATDQLQAAAAAAIAAYDPPTRAEASSDAASLATAIGDIPTNTEMTTLLSSADDATLAAISALNNLSIAQVRAIVVEDQGSTASLGCVNAVALAVLAGRASVSGDTVTYRDPSNGEVRAVITHDTSGNRTASTITCPTY